MSNTVDTDVRRSFFDPNCPLTPEVKELQDKFLEEPTVASPTSATPTVASNASSSLRVASPTSATPRVASNASSVLRTASPTSATPRVASDIVILLDASGSMKKMGTEPVESINSFIADQTKIDPNSQCSLYTFNDKLKIIYENVELGKVEPFKDYAPNGLTAYFDSLHFVVLNSNEKKNLTVLIISDGEDNCSSVDKAELGERVKTLEKENNWQVIYLGTSHDVFRAGCSLGVKMGKIGCFDQSVRGNMTRILESASIPISMFRASSQTEETPTEIKLPKLEKVEKRLTLVYREALQVFEEEAAQNNKLDKKNYMLFPGMSVKDLLTYLERKNCSLHENDLKKIAEALSRLTDTGLIDFRIDEDKLLCDVFISVHVLKLKN